MSVKDSPSLVQTSSDNDVIIPFSEADAATDDEINTFVNTAAAFTGKVNNTNSSLLAVFICKHNFPNSVLARTTEAIMSTPIYCLADITRLLLGTIPHLHLYTRDEIYRATGQYPSPDFPLCSLPNNTTAHIQKQQAQLHHLHIVKDYREFA